MKKILKEKDFIRNSDFLICNVLLYFNHTLELIDRSNSSRCIFVIKRKKDTDEILEKFHKGTLLVEPKLFQAISREIKSRMYN